MGSPGCLKFTLAQGLRRGAPGMAWRPAARVQLPLCLIASIHSHPRPHAALPEARPPARHRPGAGPGHRGRAGRQHLFSGQFNLRLAGQFVDVPGQVQRRRIVVQGQGGAGPLHPRRDGGAGRPARTRLQLRLAPVAAAPAETSPRRPGFTLDAAARGRRARAARRRAGVTAEHRPYGLAFSTGDRRASAGALLSWCWTTPGTANWPAARSVPDRRSLGCAARSRWAWR